jgi:hypothetical protein
MRDWRAVEEARNQRIGKIRSYAKQHPTYPHTTTIQQWYDWEKFEAYKLLGYQEASTYLERFDPGRGSDWCRFAPITPPGG